LLAQALEVEIDLFISQFAEMRDTQGRQRFVRNGYHSERQIQSGIGPVPVRAPRVRDRETDAAARVYFQSSILPPYLRKTKSLEALIPWLYLKGVSTGDFSDALAALLGKDAPGLSAATISRLKTIWQQDFEQWQHRDLHPKRYVYFWVDGIYCNVRMDDKQCLLVIIGATEDGFKELVAIEGGYRESELSWSQLLLNLKGRGLQFGPKLAIGDGALGFWKALGKVYGHSRAQRWLFPEKVDTVKRKVLVSVFHTQLEKDNPELSVFFADCRRPQCIRRSSAVYRDGPGTFHDRPAPFS
jgi:transposase-like protein